MSNYGNGFGFGGSLDDIINAAREFGEKMKEMGHGTNPFWFDPVHGPSRGGCCDRGFGGEEYRFYVYPPTNSYSTSEGSLVFEFALAGVSESEASISFQGDDLVLSVKAAETEEPEGRKYFHRGFKTKEIDRQKYRVPASDYLQDQAKAVFKNGVLTVTIPPKAPENEGIRIEIIRDED